MQITPLTQSSLGEQIARELRRQIVTRRISPGTRLVEGDLATKFEVSRGPVRDALKILAGEGLVRPNGRSAEITGLTEVDIDELFSLRQMLEQKALAIGMEKNPEQLHTGLDAALTAMEHAVTNGQAEAFAAADLQFHSIFYEVAGHSRLCAVWAQYRPTIEMVLLVSRETYVDLTPSIESHYTLADQIKKAGKDSALQELAWHIDNTRQRVRRFYAESSQSDFEPIDTNITP